MLGSSYGESGPAPPAAGSRAASRNNRFFANCRGAMPSAEAAILRELPLSDLEDCFCFLQMEKDETVSDCSPHIANIGRLVEVSGPSGLWFTPATVVGFHST